QQAKAKQLNDYFQHAGRIYIVVDGTADNVNIPDYLKGDPALRLALNVRMPQPIHIRADGVASVLSFSGKSHDCFIPLQSIWGAYQPDSDLENGLIWEDAVPEVIRQAMLAHVTETPSSIASKDAEASTTTPEQKPKGSTVKDVPTRPTKAPHLRIVK
ncbi:MAG: ClpXP protease specificity-enhancing factor SspB, partial [Mariprofundaceae bacterium]|nr:ClpXP protease specificity-enhancing factor SspB [Mariprofundaceae bacterium]